MSPLSGHKQVQSAPRDSAGRGTACGWGGLFLRTLFWADCRAQIVGLGAHQAAFRVVPSLTRGVMTEHGWRYHHERLDRLVHLSPER